LQSIPRSKSVVQSLILLCTWPFPTSSSTPDVSYMWVGTMMQISIQMGLNRPINPQDLTKFRIKLNDKEVAERVRTWAAYNVVAQRYDLRYLSF
jgi:transcriptional regulatory protein LEU3